MALFFSLEIYMKWLLLIASLVKPMFLTPNGPVSNPIEEFKDLITQNAMKAVIVFAAVTSLAIIFAAGIIIMALDIGAQLDQTGTLFLSSILSAGIVLCAISLLIVAIVVNAVRSKSLSHEPKQQIRLQGIGTQHPIQDAIALLIADFVKEREFKRSMKEDHLIKINNYNKSQDKISSYRH